VNLVNKTSTITVAVVGAIVALAIVAHASGALRLSPTRAAGRGAAPSAAASPVTGGGTIGYPGVPCLQGYVWRKAYPGDYVCCGPRP
jgi:hypothetical protein